MNIFVVDENPVKAAQSLCNKHIVKMPVESEMMLRYALYPLEYKNAAYLNHPCSIWTRSSKANFQWLAEHALTLVNEYKLRYKREHSLHGKICSYYTLDVGDIFELKQLTPYARAFSDCVLASKNTNTIEAYRHYYILDKYKFAKWPALWQIPDWWTEKSEKFVDKSFKDGIYTKR